MGGLPKVPQEKYQKLMGVVAKLTGKHGNAETVMPMNEATGTTHGVCIVTYDSVAEAEKAMSLHGVNLDKNHTFKVCTVDSYDEIVNRPEEFVAKRTLTNFSRAEFRDWLVDKKFREQFLLRYQQETEIYWHDTMVGQPVLCYGGEREKRNKKIWCDWKVQWSPCGSYLATVHQPGIALWAG